MAVDVAEASTPAEAGHGPNAEVMGTIRAHHAELATQLRERTLALVNAVRQGDDSVARVRLHDWYRTELIPHALAEERTLYSAAAGIESSRLLVEGMLAEHQALIGLIAELALAEEPFAAALSAASAQALFTVHLGKENDLLLPALDAAGADLAALLGGMHEILGSSAEGPDSHGCGCGCQHDAADDQAPTPLQITRAVPQQAGTKPGKSTSGDSAELDVRTLPHGQRHEIIFARLDALAPDEALVIVNDHDPKPLRYQTEALWPDRFVWSYRELGPQVWRIAIIRAH